jgi:methylenetetrahydrofolate reductase (NADPH)
MRNKMLAATMIRLLEQARYEVLPTASTEDRLLEHVPRDRVITVTASPSKGLEATFDLAERLTGHGYPVVPHLAARMVASRTELAEICERLTGKGITRVFVPGGDAEPAGDYADALSLLEDLTALGRPFAQVGITGYPESHPTIHDDLTVQAMWDKRRYATHVVSNLTFDPTVIRGWLQRMRGRGVTMPLLLGLPGPVERTKLLGMATKIGVLV